MFPFRKRLNYGTNPQKPAFINHEQAVDLVTRFIAVLETEESAKWCKCLWRVHPDDQEVTPGTCRTCGGAKKQHEEHGEHHFAGIRRTRVDTHTECPVHTREGMVLGFLNWAAKNV